MKEFQFVLGFGETMDQRELGCSYSCLSKQKFESLICDAGSGSLIQAKPSEILKF